GDIAIDRIWPTCPRIRTNDLYVAASHRTTVRSALQVAKAPTSRAVAIDQNHPVCALIRSTIRPAATFQTNSIPSPVPVSRCLPSAANAALESRPGNGSKFERGLRDGK